MCFEVAKNGNSNVAIYISKLCDKTIDFTFLITRDSCLYLHMECDICKHETLHPFTLQKWGRISPVMPVPLPVYNM